MLSKILDRLPGHPWREQIQYFDVIDSTNNYAKKLAMQGAPEGTVIIAGQQSAGRGRLGRSFSSPAGMGIYLSVILRPGCLPSDAMHLTCATAVAGCEAVESATRQKPGIKWTNDLILGTGKLGGILTEISIDAKTGKLDWAVVGIGINCCQSAEDFPPEIRDMACSLGLQTQDRAMVAAALIERLHTMAQGLISEKTKIMAAYRSRCMTVGRDISLLRGDHVRHGTALDIDEDGALLVRFTDGSVEHVASGEVSVRGMYGYL